MVAGDVNGGVVTGHTLSTVVPANVTGEVLHEFSGADLAMKLHYLRAVYYFSPGDAVDGTTVFQLKEPMFLALDVCYPAAGRIRRHDPTGRPHIKCNDSGVRIIEARCDATTLPDWLHMDVADRHKHLVYDKVLGPDLPFSPLVYMQFTRFKGGGLAVGVNWAHVLSDAVCASNTMNLWGHFIGTKQPPPKTQQQQKRDNEIASPITGNPLSVKKVEPVGDFWLASTSVPMVTFSFQISESKLKQLQSRVSSHAPVFEAIAAVVWQSLAKIRTGKEPNLVTVIRNDTSEERKHVLANKLIISTVATDSSVSKLDLSELATMISSNKEDETKAIEEVVDKENGKEDYIVYGANLTFVDMQGVDLYGLKIKGQKPAYVDYSIHGVGEEGAILVLPGPEEARDGDDAGKGGRVLTAILPESEIPKLKEVLASEWSIA